MTQPWLLALALAPINSSSYTGSHEHADLEFHSPFAPADRLATGKSGVRGRTLPGARRDRQPSGASGRAVLLGRRHWVMVWAAGRRLGERPSAIGHSRPAGHTPSSASAAQSSGLCELHPTYRRLARPDTRLRGAADRGRAGAAAVRPDDAGYRGLAGLGAGRATAPRRNERYAARQSLGIFRRIAAALLAQSDDRAVRRRARSAAAAGGRRPCSDL